MPEDLTPEEEARERARRRRRLAEIFGEVLPDQTNDDAPESREDTEASKEDWLRRQRPPHHL